jgi:hypothetical protein
MEGNFPRSGLKHKTVLEPPNLHNFSHLYDFSNYFYYISVHICVSVLSAINTNGEKRNAYRILVGKPEGKKPLCRPRRRWVDNSKIDLREIGWGGMDWIYLA